jgi:hypothetical protein
MRRAARRHEKKGVVCSATSTARSPIHVIHSPVTPHGNYWCPGGLARRVYGQPQSQAQSNPHRSRLRPRRLFQPAERRYPLIRIKQSQTGGACELEPRPGRVRWRGIGSVTDASFGRLFGSNH